MRLVKVFVLAAAASLPLLSAMPAPADAQRRGAIFGGGVGPRAAYVGGRDFGYRGRGYGNVAYRSYGYRGYGYRRGGFGRGLALGVALGAAPVYFGSRYYYDRPYGYGYYDYDYRPYRTSYYGYRPTYRYVAYSPRRNYYVPGFRRRVFGVGYTSVGWPGSSLTYGYAPAGYTYSSGGWCY